MEVIAGTKKRFGGDKVLWIIYLILITFSVVEVFSASSTLAYQGSMYKPILYHGATILLATVEIFFLTKKLSRRILSYLPFVYIVVLFLVIYASVGGENINEASRWIKIPGTPITFQPSEMAKVSLILLAAFLLKKRTPLQEDVSIWSEQTLPKRFYLLAGLSALLIAPILKDNLSTALLMILFVFAMGYIVLGFSKPFFKVLGIALGGLLLGVLIFLTFPKDVQESLLPRASVWINRNKTENFGDEQKNLTEEQKDSLKYVITDKNFQEQHAKMAIARGMPFGVVPGNSKERDFLPQAYSDFIYAIILEETGLIGGFLIPFLYLWLFFRLAMLSRRCRNAYHALILMGFGILYVLQAIVNLCVATGVIPVTGQTLPFVSKGGTSVLITGFAFGILLAISRYIQEEEHSAVSSQSDNSSSSEENVEGGSDQLSVASRD
ncbi:MAG: FtsW/RodA/SpoVE family cell cycle protein [Porphyromonas sp.]|nr:FtsW/RodA/SpoVE family cell cycle protein [Porphyromonas sp.]